MPDKKFIAEALRAHNEYRTKHQVTPLKHASDLSDYAQKWVDQLARSNSFQHSNATHKGERLGENIAMKWSSQPDAYTGQEVTDQWYSEVKMHTFGIEPRSLNTGHFTQVVWKGSKEFGIAKARTSDGKILVVANYRPAGNMAGQFAANVLCTKDGKITLPADSSPSKSHSVPIERTSHSTSRFADFDRDSFFNRGDSNNTVGSSRGESRSVRTYTTTENGVSKTVTEETITKPDGTKVTNRKVTTTSGGSGGGSGGSTGKFDETDFGRLSLGSDKRFAARQPVFESAGSNAPSGVITKPQKASEFIEDTIKHHNICRTKHGVPSLKHSQQLSDYAQNWADHLASSNGFQHSQCKLGSEQIGENIACKWSSGGADYTGQEVTDQWYSEIRKHDFKNNNPGLGTGHFTQVVWKGTKEIGIGKARSSGGKVIVVANYRPAGNMLGTYVENVLPPRK